MPVRQRQWVNRVNIVFFEEKNRILKLMYATNLQGQMDSAHSILRK
jgi:hypothetical protein